MKEPSPSLRISSLAKKRLTLAAIVILAISLGINRLVAWQDRLMLRTLLNLPELPASIQALECTSCALTDVVSVCRFKMEPGDYERIVSAYPYEKREMNPKTLSSADCRMEFGFAPAELFHHVPARFKHGGEIQLWVNAERTAGLVDYYEE